MEQDRLAQYEVEKARQEAAIAKVEKERIEEAEKVKA